MRVRLSGALAVAFGCWLCTAGRGAEPIRGNVEWSGTVVIREPTTVFGRVKCLPGTKVLFAGKGSILCHGGLEANGTVFEAREPCRGKSRIRVARGGFELEGCTLRNMITTDRRYHNTSVNGPPLPQHKRHRMVRQDSHPQLHAGE